MSYERAESFEEGADADAPIIESEFDNIADYLNGLFKTARVGASSDLTLLVAVKDVPGATATIVASKPSKLLVWTTFDFEVVGKFLGERTAVGYLYVDSAQQNPAAIFKGETDDDRITVSQNFCVSLGTGSHEVKLRAACAEQSQTETMKASTTHTGFLYLLIPEP